MKNEEDGEQEAQEVEVAVEAASTASSPPTPSSPLPVSVGPGNQRYAFSSSSHSPSPPSSGYPSAEELPLLRDKIEPVATAAAAAPLSVFSLDWPPEPSRPVSHSSCLKDLLDWFVQRCCSCCFWTLTPSQLIKPHES